jgi:hypothetical protein
VTHRNVTLLSLIALLSVASATGQPRAVQVGYCSTLKNIDAAKAAGFDYVELGTSEIAALTDAEFEQTIQRIKALGLPVPVTNLFIPANVKITGPQANPQQMIYIKKAFARLARSERLSFEARRATDADGVSKEGYMQLLISGAALPTAKPHGITIVTSLRPAGDEHHQPAAEGLACRDRSSELPAMTIYHLASEQEDPEIVIRAKPYIHLHMANSRGACFR